MHLTATSPPFFLPLPHDRVLVWCFNTVSDSFTCNNNDITTTATTMAGDAVCQAIETVNADKKFVWDSARTLRMGITGAFLVTPASFSWNLYAERLAPGTSWKAVLTKLGVSMAVTPPMVS